MALRALGLCDGYGGMSLGLKLALGDGIRTVARVERDAYAAAVLVARMEESRLDQAPVWDDLETFDGGAWRGCVDLITAGFPCQPFSAAGRREGVDDDRWLWPAIGRIIRDVGPRFVFLENVPGLVQHGLPHVLADLADLGFDAEWGLLAASDVGAPHRRQRFWLVAALADTDRDGLSGFGRESDDDRDARHDTDGPRGTNVADASGVDEREPHYEECTQSRQRTRADTGRAGFPPHPDDTDGWERWIAEGGPEPSLRRGVDGRPVGLADALHLGGNGLVPACAAHAFTQLLNRLTTDKENR